MSTVSAGTPPRNDNANTPQQIPAGGQTVPPSKPRPTTGTGGAGPNPPKTGK